MPAAGVIKSIGAGPDLVMVHGWAAHRGIWGRFAECLASSFRLHMVDLPGHGQMRHVEDWTGVESLLAGIQGQFPGAHWLGWSLGGLLAVITTLKSPARTGKLVLLSASACFLAKKNWPGGMKVADFEDFRAGMQKDDQATLQRFIALQTHGTKESTRTRQALEDCLASAAPARSALLSGLDTLAKNDISANISLLRNRCMLISGEYDRIVSAAAVAQTAALIPGAQHHSIGKAGHATFISHPDELCELVAGFLQQERKP